MVCSARSGQSVQRHAHLQGQLCQEHPNSHEQLREEFCTCFSLAKDLAEPSMLLESSWCTDSTRLYSV